jgi:hypothetical protein
LLVAPPADATGARDIVVRLGVAEGLPLTLGRIQVSPLEASSRITRAEATLCGPDAAAVPLTVSLPGRPAAVPRSPTLAAEAVQRHPSDDLCIRWWASP